MSQRVTVADMLERCATDLQSAAFDFREDARSQHFAEQRIARAEDACARARAAVRGR